MGSTQTGIAAPTRRDRTLLALVACILALMAALLVSFPPAGRSGGDALAERLHVQLPGVTFQTSSGILHSDDVFAYARPGDTVLARIVPTGDDRYRVTMYDRQQDRYGAPDVVDFDMLVSRIGSSLSDA